MEELEKENCTCGCCDECNCGSDCHCTPDNKCCDDCTCGERQCNCGENCNCTEHCDCDQNCECDNENKCSESCDCDNQKGNNQTEDEQTYDELAEEEQTKGKSVEDEKCKCGCGEELEEESTADAYFKQLLSLKAEFDNYRKRTQNDIAKAYSNGFNQAITEFLPALDSFKMATEYITDPNTLMGIQYIEKGILSTLEKIGVKVIDVSGKFDPNFHQAIGSEVSPEHESGDIIKECFKGFTMGDKVIRYSQVIVAK